MYDPKNRYWELTDRVRQRDAAAALEMQRDLEPNMVHMVRYTLRSRKATTPLARRILAEAERFPRPASGFPPEDDDNLVRHIAHRVCAAAIDRLRARSDESYRPLDTLCA